jgi:hypothetical protein
MSHSPNDPPTPDDTPELPPGPGFGATFLYYFLGTALVTTLLATQTLGMTLETGIPTQFGLLVGAVGGLIGAFANRSNTLVVPCPSEKKFNQQLDTVLTDMGYSQDQEASIENVLVYRRPPLRQAFSGKVYVLIQDNQAQIRSRAIHISSIKQRLEKAGIK